MREPNERTSRSGITAIHAPAQSDDFVIAMAYRKWPKIDITLGTLQLTIGTLHDPAFAFPETY